MKNVVEYERKTGKDKTGKGEEHLKEKKFLDAMKLLKKNEDED